MRKYLVSVFVTFVIIAIAVIAWAPNAKSEYVQTDCLDFCEQETVCQCAKVLGGSLRLTACNILAECVYTGYGYTGSQCQCEVTPICKKFLEIPLVLQSFPPGNSACGSKE